MVFDVSLVFEALGERFEEVRHLLFGRDGRHPLLAGAGVLLGCHALERLNHAERRIERLVHRFDEVIVAVLEGAGAPVLEEHLHPVGLAPEDDGEPPLIALRVAEEGAHGRLVVVNVQIHLGAIVTGGIRHEVSCV